MDLRRLAAVDMYGTRGTLRRRRIILAEFVIALIGGLAIAVVVLGVADGAPAAAFGVWALGVSLNYLPLAVHAVALTRPGALAAELEGVDIGAELRRYTVLQLWVFVPFLFLVFAVVPSRGSRSS